ncbi:GFA family protein [Novosphingobium colocasiae]|uniref:GFA family protein n=1 Tax=Novosphingobium colocasiae TaxID=1256513 RepID=UPI0035B48301
MIEGFHEGGCGCGHVRYRVEGEPIFVNNCHCRQCQQQTGGTSVVNAFYEGERFVLVQGAFREHIVTAGSGGPHTICRCSACGTAVLSFYPRMGRLGAGLRVGTLDDASWVTPDAVIFTGEAMPWVAFPAGIPAFETTYNALDLLPPERVARLKALVERRKAGEG